MKISEWKLAQKIQASGRRGVIIGLLIALAIIAAVVITIIKVNWIKKNFGCGCDMGEFDEDYYLDADDLDEHGCAYAGEKDFA
ncbi:MAG: hypothetical protein FWF79_02515 [Defluviitaleaceae bacterium]|nr:hypothetical protein [Defluviitaleaceae bacterium]